MLLSNLIWQVVDDPRVEQSIDWGQSLVSLPDKDPLQELSELRVFEDLGQVPFIDSSHILIELGGEIRVKEHIHSFASLPMINPTVLVSTRWLGSPTPP